MSGFSGKSEAVEFCARPLARRLYKTVVAGLAVFFVTLVAFKQDFRGYLAEARLTGPVMEGLDLEEATAWVKRIDTAVAAVANRPSAMPGKGQLRITFIAMQPQAAAARVDELAERWLYQYLPDRLQAYRHSALVDLRRVANHARQREDQIRQQLEELRQTQLAQLQSQAPAEPTAAVAAAPAAAVSHEISSRNAILQKLADLRLALAGLAGERTAEHPRVQSLQLEAASLEQQLGLLPGQSLPQVASGAGSAFVSHSMSRAPAGPQIADVASQISTALAVLGAAARARQTAEFRLSERMQELANETTSVHWAKAGSVVVTRLGGTPRCSTLILAGLLALVAGIVTFRAERFEVAECSLKSTTEVASTLELPVLGDLAELRGYATAWGRRWLSPARMQLLVRTAEVVVATAALACLLSIAFEPALMRQVLADPFGALSEVLGRFGV